MPIRVYIEDTDAGGIVFYANYLKFMERARTEWLRGLGVELDVWQREHGILFVVRKVDIEYLAPARFNDQLQATFELNVVKRASLTCKQAIICNERILTTADVTLVCVNAESLAPRAVPPTIREAMSVEH